MGVFKTEPSESSSAGEAKDRVRRVPEGLRQLGGAEESRAERAHEQGRAEEEARDATQC